MEYSGAFIERSKGKKGHLQVKGIFVDVTLRTE